MATLFDLSPAEDSGTGLRLNEAQRRAVEHGEGPLLVIAGAGTGKTRVITERIRHLLAHNPQLSGENILGLTFTDKAAGEMKSRVVDSLGERAKGVRLTTFHSFCKELLAELEPDRLLLENVDHWILLRRNMPRLQLEKFRRLAEPGQFLADFVEFFSRCQDELVTSEDYQRYADRLAADLEAAKGAFDEATFHERAEQVALQQEIARAYRASEALLREKQRLTFGALLAEAVGRLRSNAALRRTLQERFQHVLVDEFQDTNIAQLELLWLLAEERRNVLVVGDNDQAIYRFRGASFGSFAIFLERFAGIRGAGDPAKHRISLTENYRSTARILRVAGQVISLNEVSELFPQKILTPTKPEGERIRIVELASNDEEARWVAGELERLHVAGRPWSDFAVLYRQHAHRDELVEELARRRIPFVIKNLSIFSHPLVRDVLAYLRLIGHPGDNVAAARVLAAPAWGFTAADVVRLAERAAKNRGMPLLDALESPQGELPFSSSSGGARPATAELLEFLAAQRKTLRTRAASQVLSELLEWLGVYERAAEAARRYVRRLARFVEEWEPKSETRGLVEFLEYLDYFEQAGGQINLEEEPAGDAVQLMTVHAAKGLEFPHVFILRLNQGAFPARQRPRVFEFPEALMKEELPKGDFHIQEERRLFYVALTRAKDRLTLTSVVNAKSKPSPFLEDILMEPSIQRKDVARLAPRVPPSPKSEEAGEPLEASLFSSQGTPPKIFSRIAEWAKEFHPPAPEPLRLSASAIDVYRGCPQRYLFARLWSIAEGPGAAMSFGSVMHTTIKRFVGELRKGRVLPFEDVAAIFEQEWTSAGFEDEYQQEEYKKEGLEQLRAFHADLAASPPNVREQEKSFELPLEHNVIITGRMDQINSLGKRDVEVVDYKTGRAKTDSAARKDLQLSLYALAAREILELNPVRLVFHYLQGNQRQVTTRDPKQLNEAVEAVQEVAADIRAGEFPPQPGFACRSCAFQPICPAHEEPLLH